MMLYVEATLWDGGECIACWTSETPGKTGPVTPLYGWLRMALRGWRIRLRRRA